MIKPLRLAVFASGNGSNFQALIEAIAGKQIHASIELLVCDRPKAYVVERAKQAAVETFVFRPKEYASREQYEVEIARLLKARDIDVIVLAGYMRLITDTLVQPYYGKMINIHPSLLPSFPGVDAIVQAYEHGVKITGVTVHFVDGGLDSGPIIAQRTVEIAAGESLAALTARIHAVEHELLPQVIGWMQKGLIQLDGRIVKIVSETDNILQRRINHDD